jgi:hypothetical protein
MFFLLGDSDWLKVKRYLLLIFCFLVVLYLDNHQKTVNLTTFDVPVASPANMRSTR